MSASVMSINVDQTSGETVVIVPGIAGKRIEVLSFMLTVERGALGTNSTLRDETSNTVRVTLTSESATAVVPYWFHGSKDSPAFKVAVGEGLELVTGASAIIAGVLTFHYV